MRVVDSFDMKDNEEYFEESLHGVFEKYTNEVDGIYVTSGLSAPLCRYLEKNGLDIPLVTFDTYGEIKEYMAKGVVSATIAQDVTKQMQTAFDLLVRYIISGDIPPATVYTDVQLVLRSNMHQFD
jgi:ABC-type sugar transport system substrate-binding protein